MAMWGEFSDAWHYLRASQVCDQLSCTKVEVVGHEDTCLRMRCWASTEPDATTSAMHAGSFKCLLVSAACLKKASHEIGRRGAAALRILRQLKL